VKYFFSLFSAGRLEFLPNPFSPMADDFEKEYLESPPKFFDNDFSGLFIHSAGNMLLIWILVAFCYLLITVLHNFTRKKLKFIQSLKQSFEWSALLRTWVSTYFEIIIASILGLRVPHFGSFLRGFSTILSFIFFLLSILFPFGIFYKVKSMQKSPASINKFRPIVEDYDLKRRFCKYFVGFVILKRAL